ncbi:hypothetical protein MP228_000309 [Amoeboaphelidium protococcarum]|nr:hypothetical protein MP228_000309 [Amoeboaphelidium protococcarum]
MTRRSKRINVSKLDVAVKKQRSGYNTSMKLFVCQVLPLVIQHQSDCVNNNGLKRGDNLLILLLKWKNDNCWLSSRIFHNLLSLYSSLDFINDFAIVNNAAKFDSVFQQQINKSAFDMMTGQINGKSLHVLMHSFDVKNALLWIQKLGYDPMVPIDYDDVQNLQSKFSKIRQKTLSQAQNSTPIEAMKDFVDLYDYFVQSVVESNVHVQVQSYLIDIVYYDIVHRRSAQFQTETIKMWLLPIIRYECKVRGDQVHFLVNSVWEIVKDDMAAIKDFRNDGDLHVRDIVRRAVKCCKAWINEPEGR